MYCVRPVPNETSIRSAVESGEGVSDEKTPSGFVIKAVTATGLEMWVSRERFGNRIFGPRENAEVFRTRSEAHAAISVMPRTIKNQQAIFSVEPAV
jgi:hypothetical protein